MKLSWNIVTHQLKEPFKIAHGTYTTRRALMVSIQISNKTGYGECTEIDYYNIDLASFELQLASLKVEFSLLKRMPPLEFYSVLQLKALHPFLQSALDCAYWDVHGKLEQKTIASLNNWSVNVVPQSSITISINSIQHQVGQIYASEWEYFKVKVNTWSTEIRDQLLATNKKISIDDNGSFSIEQCKQIAQDVTSSQFLYFEQPMTPGKEFYSFLNATDCVNWMADEDVQHIDDLKALLPHYATVNIKVMKCGGITPAIALIAAAKKLGFKIMIGCMTESTVGISAGIALAHFADYLDLDGTNLIANDKATGSFVKNGLVYLSKEYGLGITLMKEFPKP